MDSRSSLHEKASQETFISLLQLDPAPMDSPQPDKEKDLPPLPEDPLEASTGSLRSSTTAGTTTSSIGLSGSANGHSSVYYLTRVQRYSSYTFSFFAVLHLATTSLIPFATRSVPASESYLLLARELYQTPLSEPLLVALPLVAHVASGTALRLIRRRHNLRRYGGGTPGVYALHRARTAASTGSTASQARTSPWPHLSWVALSGYAAAAAVGAHALVNRGLPLFADGDSSATGLAFVAHGFARHPAVAWAAYVALLGVAGGHMVWGWAKWLGVAQKAGWRPAGPPTGHKEVDRTARTRRRRVWLAIQSAAAALVGLWAVGGLGVVARGGAATGWVAKVYDEYYKKIPFL